MGALKQAMIARAEQLHKRTDDSFEHCMEVAAKELQPAFKKCGCGRCWRTRAELQADLSYVGIQHAVSRSFLVYNCHCGTSLSIPNDGGTT
jgi:hypothetical protein